MGVYLNAKFKVSSIILTGFRHGGILRPPTQIEPLKSPPRLGLSNVCRGRGLWKFNNSLISNINFVDEMKTLIQKVVFSPENDTYLADQVKWELLKYKIHKSAVNFPRKVQN